MKKIRRRCKCGCGGITNYGKIYIKGHYWQDKKLSEGHKRKIGIGGIGKKYSEETKLKMSENHIGFLDKKHTKETKLKMSLAHKGVRRGIKFSKAHKINLSLSHLKCNPNYPYCDVWRDREYKKDIRKDYCENKNCKKVSKRLHNHHIFLDKKKCAPYEIMTLCNSCHAWLHNKLKKGIFIIINRIDHVSYINKSTRKIIKIERIEK